MRANANTIRTYRTPIQQANPETAREKLPLKREWVSDVGLIAATVAMIILVTHALRLGLENYTILGW